MKLTGELQEALVALLLYDSDARAVAKLLRWSDYDPYYAQLVEQIAEYIDRYEQAPGEHAIDLVRAVQDQNPDDSEIYERIWESILEIKDNLNREFVLTQIKHFARFQTVRRSIGEAVDALRPETPEALEAAEKVLTDGLDSSYELFESGVLLQDTARSTAFLNREKVHAFPTGIPEFDKLHIGPVRKGLTLFGAAPGRGKSWWLVSLAKYALLTSQRVLYITLEMDEDEVCQRLFQSMFSIRRRDAEIEVSRFQRDGDGDLVGFERSLVKSKLSFDDGKIGEKLLETARALDRRPKLYVKEFPTGSLTLPQLEGFIDTLAASKRFIPDLVIIDYADLMEVDPGNYRLALADLYKRLRGVAVKRNIAVATASQLHRGAGGGRQVASEENIAEDFSKIATVDSFITYNQTAAEHSLGLARLFVAKARTERGRFAVLISQSYATGQFVVDSMGEVAAYWDLINRDEGDDDNAE